MLMNLGFWEEYLIDYALSGSQAVSDFNTILGKVIYIIWCYLHMGLGDWIKWLAPPFAYGHGSDDIYWLYWICHVAVTVALVKLIYKFAKFVLSGKFANLFKQSYEFDTNKLNGAIKLAHWYQTREEKFFRAPSNKMYRSHYKSISLICIELWLDNDKNKSYATIIRIGDTFAMSLHDDFGREVYTTKCSYGDIVTFGSKEKNDPNVTRLFNRLSSNARFLNKEYEDNRVLIKE